MSCNPEVLTQVPLFSRLDPDEAAVLAGQVELKTFAPRQRIYKRGDEGGRGYVMVSGTVRVSTVDEDHQEVIVDDAIFLTQGQVLVELEILNRERIVQVDDEGATAPPKTGYLGQKIARYQDGVSVGRGDF